MTKKKKKDIFQFNSDSDVDFDLMNSRLEKNENRLKKQEAVSNSHLQLFEETLASLSKDYTEIKELKKRVFILTWCLGCVGLVCFSILAFISYFIFPFIF
jgi:hypothetical protein